MSMDLIRWSSLPWLFFPRVVNYFVKILLVSAIFRVPT